MSGNAELKHTVLHDLHLELGAKMVPFAGYLMPVQFPLGVMGEHLHTRSKAGLFDVSHMGQALLKGKSGLDAAQALESLVPGNICGLKSGGQRYTMFLNSSGGILDDLIVTRPEGSESDVYLVVNAACKKQDFDLLKAELAEATELSELDNRSLLALQGPAAFGVLEPLFPEIVEMGFMTQRSSLFEGTEVYVSRSGYTVTKASIPKTYRFWNRSFCHGMTMSGNAELKHTVLHDLHLELGAKMVPFAGYLMPVQFPLGVMGEHLHTRSKAGLFDVSHMGQALLKGKSGLDAAQALESLVPGDICGLKGGGQRYTMFLK